MLDAETKKMAEELLFSEKKKPSFAKQLFSGRLDSKILLPFPSLPSDAKREADLYVERVRAFAKEKIDPVKIDREAKIPDAVIEGLGELGLLSLTIPKEYGGLGLSQYAYCRAEEAIAERCAATALFINAHQSVGLKALLLFGTEEQKKKWLPRLSKGRSLAAFSLTEKNAGSDAAGIETTAQYDPEKRVYRINGRKQWTTNGSIADVLTVMAKTDGKVTAFIATPDMKGFSVLDKSLDKVGMRGSTTSNLLFENVEVPEENILGPKGGGLKVCLTVLDYGRTTFGATCTGAAKEAVRLATEHAKTRYQFKRPLASFPLVKRMLARMHAHLYAMESATLFTAGLLDLGASDIMLESAILKVFTSETLWQILYDAMQIFGGRSFFTDNPLERMMRDARLNSIGEGSNDVLRAFIGAVGLREAGYELKEAAGIFKRVHAYFVPPMPGYKNGAVRGMARSYGFAVRTFSNGCLKALFRYREGVVEKQLVLDRIAEGAISLYTAASVLSRLDGIDDPLEIEKGMLYVDLAIRKANACMERLFDPLDDAIEKLSDKITGLR